MITYWLNIYDNTTELWLARIRLPSKPSFITALDDDVLGEWDVVPGSYQELGIVCSPNGSISFTVEPKSEGEIDCENK